MERVVRTDQEAVKGVTTRSPISREDTPGPFSTTVPVNSWPMMNPVSDGWWPRKTCSSLGRCQLNGESAMLIEAQSVLRATQRRHLHFDDYILPMLDYRVVNID